MRPDGETLKLHVAADGVVWYAAGSGPPACAGCSAADFLAGLAGVDRLGYRRARAAAAPANAALLVGLFDARAGGRLSGVEVCSPLAASSHRPEDPAAVLCQLRQWGGRRPSQGGWRELTQHDYPTLVLAARVAAGGAVCPTRHARYIYSHPAWPYLSFVRGLDVAACFTLLATVIDPRNYVDPLHPDRGARLEAFLGLRRRRLRPGAPVGRREQILRARAGLALRAWKADDVPPAVWGSDPGCFLWRTWRRYANGDYADMRASQRFVSYLRHAWLGALYDASRQAESLFAPDHFFDTAAEVDALRRHLARVAADGPESALRGRRPPDPAAGDADDDRAPAPDAGCDDG